MKLKLMNTKTITFRNKAHFLLEFLLVNLINIVFISFIIIFFNKIKYTKENIEKTIYYDKVNNIVEDIIKNISYSESIIIKGKSIKIDDIKLIFKDNKLLLYTSNMKKPDTLFIIKGLIVEKENNKIKIIFIINDKKSIKRIISLK